MYIEHLRNRLARKTAPVPVRILLLSVFFFIGGNIAQAQPNCSSPQLIDVSLPAGGRWEMCWEVRSEEGVVLKDIYFTSQGGTQRQVLKEASVAQIEQLYDDNRVGGRLHYVTDAGLGLGGSNLADLSSNECPGTLIQDQGINVLCQATLPRGYLFKYYGQRKQGDALELFSVSHIGGRAWVVRWRFFDDGIIEPSIGLSGQLEAYGTDATYGSEVNSSANNVAVASTINYYWRLDFDIGGNGDDIVEQIELTPTDGNQKKEISVAQINSETAVSINPLLKRSWRIRDSVIKNSDDHYISYHLDPLHAGYAGPGSDPWSANDLYVTVYDACERFISGNPTGGGSCGSNVTQFLTGQNTNTADIVLWYKLTYHHLPRDEDEPTIPIRWDKFQILPRDWTSINPLASRDSVQVLVKFV